MSDPTHELSRLLRFTDEDRVAPSEATQLREEFESFPFHTLGGNHVRFERGRIQLHLDDAWKTEMQPTHKLVVTALTLPLLMAYGYVGIPVKLRDSISNVPGRLESRSQMHVGIISSNHAAAPYNDGTLKHLVICR